MPTFVGCRFNSLFKVTSNDGEIYRDGIEFSCALSITDAISYCEDEYKKSLKHPIDFIETILIERI